MDLMQRSDDNLEKSVGFRTKIRRGGIMRRRSMSYARETSLMLRVLVLQLVFILQQELSTYGVLHISFLSVQAFQRSSRTPIRNRQRNSNDSFYSKMRQRYSSIQKYRVGMVSDNDILSVNGIKGIIDDIQLDKGNKKDSEKSTNHFFDRAILNHKLQGLHLSDQKLLVLQDAAKRMVQRHEAQMKETQDHHVTTTTTTIEQLKVKHQKEMNTIIKAMEKRVHAIELERNNVVNELRTTKHDFRNMLDTQRKDNNRQIEDIKLKYEQDRTVWIDAERRLSKKIEYIENDSTLTIRDANETIHTLRVELQQQKDSYQLLKTRYENITQRYHRSKEQIDQLRNRIEELLLEQETYKAKEIQQQEYYQERMDIAESAVSAATNREITVQQMHDSMQRTNYVLQESIVQLEQQLQQQMDINKNLESMIATKHIKQHVPIVSIFVQKIRSWVQWNNDQSFLRVTSRWIKYVFLPRIIPIDVIQRDKRTKHSIK
jgi:hypothetical protein